MSKIGRKAITLGSVQVEIKGQEIHFKGPKTSGIYVLPHELQARLDGNSIFITALNPHDQESKKLWGLHRALLANAIRGSHSGFEKQLVIEGLGFKAALSGSKVVFMLGYSHKIDLELPKGITLEIDKTGQKLTFKSADRALIGHVCSQVKALRPPEPYKGTGIRGAQEVLVRKAGKTKSA